MKRLSLLLVAGILVSGLVPGSALAAENSWTGFYVGGNLGYATADADSDIKSLGGNWSGESQALRDYITSNSAANQSPSGVAFGLQAGYDYQFDNKFILGLEADYSELDLDESRQTGFIVSPVAPNNFAFSNKVDVKQVFSLRPKLGYVFDKTVVFVTAGFAWTSAEFSSDLLGTNGYSKVGKTSKTLNSAIWGVGVERKFFNNISAKLEYLKINGNDTNYTTAYRAGSTLPGYSETFNVDLDYDIVRLGINYRF